MSLDQQLQKQSQESQQKIPTEAQEVMKTAQEQLEQSGLLDGALTQGDTVPDFVLENQYGDEVSMYESLEDGPIIISFYRGGWCPYCNLELQALQNNLDAFHEAGAALIAITPQNQDESRADEEKHKLEFDILSDPNNVVAEEFGLVYELSDELVSLYDELGIDIEKHNGEGETRLPLAATYVVDTNKEVVYSFVKYDYRKRAEPSEILEAVKNT
jgi:peroxiredoxin